MAKDKNPTTLTGTDDAAAVYWQNPISRREAQVIFDELSVAIRGLQGQETAAALTLSFLFMKLGIQQEEYETFIRARLELEREAQVPKTAKTPSKPSVN